MLNIYEENFTEEDIEMAINTGKNVQGCWAYKLKSQ